MITARLRLAMFVLASVILLGPEAEAALIYESATPVVTSTVDDSLLSSVVTDATVYSGVNFQLLVPTHITAIGGHFYDQSGNKQIFGVILAATSLFDVPLASEIKTNFLAKTLIDLPIPVAGFGGSGTVSGALDIVLPAGFYSEVFGSGLFGTTGESGAVINVKSPTFTGDVNSGGVDTYAIRVSDGVHFWQADGARYFVEGTAVPEFSSILLTTLSLSALGIASVRGSRR